MMPSPSITLKQDFKKHLLRIKVKRAPGMRTTVVQVSRDPITATSWEELPGDGAFREIERGECERRRTLEIARNQKSPGRQGRERVDIVARSAKVSGENGRGRARGVLVGGGRRI